MNHIERVKTAIEHREPDKVPKGEIGTGIDERLMQVLLGNKYKPQDEFQSRKTVLELLDMDLVSVGLDGPPLKVEKNSPAVFLFSAIIYYNFKERRCSK